MNAETKPTVRGHRDCEGTHGLCDWMTRQGLEFEYEEASEHELSLPILETQTLGIAKCKPSEAAQALKLQRVPSKDEYDVVIVGAGPAGLSAAIHAAAEGLSTLVLEAYAVGGQMGNSQNVQNYAGFQGSGAQLAIAMQGQARRLGAEIIVACPVRSVQPPETAEMWGLKVLKDRLLTVETEEFSVRARALIAANGCQPVEISGCEAQAGVYYGMTSEDLRKVSPGQRVMVVGSGNGAGQAAVALAEKKAKVVLVADNALNLSMSKYLTREIDRFTSTELDTYEGFKLGKLERVPSIADGAEENPFLAYLESALLKTTVRVSEVFMFTGSQSAMDWLKNALEPGMLAEEGKVAWLRMKPSESRQSFLVRGAKYNCGVFAIGDAVEGFQGRIAVAAGQGAAVVVEVLKYLASEEK